MYKPKTEQERILHRLKIAKGHLEKVMTMVATNAYCIDVMHQSHAVQKALQETDAVVLEHHLQTCVAENMKKGNIKESVAEIMAVVKKGR